MNIQKRAIELADRSMRSLIESECCPDNPRRPTSWRPMDDEGEFVASIERSTPDVREAYEYLNARAIASLSPDPATGHVMITLAGDPS